MIFKPSILSLTLLSCSTISNSYAEDVMEVITVKGDFRESSLQKTANSLSVLTNKEIDARNAQHIEEIIARAPNVNFSSGSQRSRYYQIRGIGERSQFQQPINPSVGLVIDGIDFSGIGSIASTFDAKQIEVYRGPQGTRFGASAMAGIINIETHDPNQNFEGKLRLSAGNYNSYSAGLVLSGPVSEKINYRLAVKQYNSDGFIENDYLQRDDTNNRDEFTFRGKLAIEASDDLTMNITAFVADFDNGYDAFSLDNTRHTLSDEPGFDNQNTKAFAVVTNYSGFDTYTLTLLASYADSDLDYGYDEDWSFVGIRPDWEYSSTDYYFRNKQSVTLELRASSDLGNEIFNGSTAWVTGVYFKRETTDLSRQYTYAANDFSSQFDTDNIAAFVQFDSQLTEQLTLITGLRLERRNADYSDNNLLAFSPKDTMVGGKISLAYQLDEQQLIYGAVNRGYKAGGVNIDGSLQADLREFDPEYLWNYEVGYKVRFFDDQAYIRSALFYMDRDKMQINTSYQIVREDGSTEFISYFGNAATGKNIGIELETGWQLSADIEFYATVGLLDTEYQGFINSDGVDKSGEEQAHAPSYQFSLGVNYQITDALFFDLSIEGKDEFSFSDSHQERSDDFEIVNLSVSYQTEDWTAKLWARNLFDEEYQTRGFYFGNDPRIDYDARAYYQLAEPAVFGLTFDYNF